MLVFVGRAFRIFASKEVPSMGLLHWSSGHAHVLGGARTILPPSIDARRLAEEHVSLHGGVAWDSPDAIDLVVSAPSAPAFRLDAVVTWDGWSHTTREHVDWVTFETTEGDLRVPRAWAIGARVWSTRLILPDSCRATS